MLLALTLAIQSELKLTVKMPEGDRATAVVQSFPGGGRLNVSVTRASLGFRTLGKRSVESLDWTIDDEGFEPVLLKSIETTRGAKQILFVFRRSNWLDAELYDLSWGTRQVWGVSTRYPEGLQFRLDKKKRVRQIIFYDPRPSLAGREEPPGKRFHELNVYECAGDSWKLARRRLISVPLAGEPDVPTLGVSFLPDGL